MTHGYDRKDEATNFQPRASIQMELPTGGLGGVIRNGLERGRVRTGSQRRSSL